MYSASKIGKGGVSKGVLFFSREKGFSLEVCVRKENNLTFRGGGENGKTSTLTLRKTGNSSEEGGKILISKGREGG